MNKLMHLLACYMILLVAHKECMARTYQQDISLAYVCRSRGGIDLDFSREAKSSIRYGLAVCGQVSNVIIFTGEFQHGTVSSSCGKHKTIDIYLFDHVPSSEKESVPIRTYVIQCNTTDQQQRSTSLEHSLQLARSSLNATTYNTDLTMKLVNVSGPITFGDLYRLRISALENHTIFPESCFASGDHGFKTDVVTLMEQGCSKDVTILTGFHTCTDKSTVEASLQGFHMLHSKTVFIQCVVKFCKSTLCQVKPKEFKTLDCNNYGYVKNITSVADGLSQTVVTYFTVETPNHSSSSEGTIPTTALITCLLILSMYISSLKMLI